jgi:hypothetical protein
MGNVGNMGNLLLIARALAAKFAPVTEISSSSTRLRVVFGVTLDGSVDFGVGNGETGGLFDADDGGFETGGTPLAVHRTVVDDEVAFDDELDLSAERVRLAVLALEKSPGAEEIVGSLLTVSSRLDAGALVALGEDDVAALGSGSHLGSLCTAHARVGKAHGEFDAFFNLTGRPARCEWLRLSHRTLAGGLALVDVERKRGAHARRVGGGEVLTYDAESSDSVLGFFRIDVSGPTSRFVMLVIVVFENDTSRAKAERKRVRA